MRQLGGLAWGNEGLGMRPNRYPERSEMGPGGERRLSPQPGKEELRAGPRWGAGLGQRKGRVRWVP